MPKDQCFDGIAHKFSKNIYGSVKGEIRTRVVWQDLQKILNQATRTRPLRVLDAGGGFGYFSQKLATLGHQVVLCDLSAEMLDLARQQIEAAGLCERITLLHCGIQELGEHLKQPFDLVLCHAVLEWLADPETTLEYLYPFVKEGGDLSLLFYNRDGLLYHSLLMGHFDYIERGLKTRKTQKLTPNNPQRPQDVASWLEGAGFTISGKTGVRVIYDYMRHPEVGREQSETLFEMELRYCREEPYASLGRYMHFMAKKS
ncbi:methyltransferase domain-containing protein [Dongshaea marina]|uniref:methyltransferase domain-containing protein n=1 Tax=Dongshaea marina TaxID=2047966 RepID=UPI000D3E1A4F|nr:methyltransferase domain-containing protein [Dongshaea marina]